jgi:hypothetical protein
MEVSAMGATTDRDFQGIRVSAVDWPILLVEFPVKRVPDASLHSVLGHMESLLSEAVNKREQLFVITDISAMREVTPASQRRYTAEWIKRTHSLAQMATVGGATVTPSPILRGIMTAVFWLQPSARPMFTVATREEGMLRAIQMLRDQRVPLPPRLVEYGDSRGLSGAV